ncbi:MAG: response regulator [Desulfobacterales bacterium]|nr:response regulator [Desulfobacterales bacterium]
MEKIKLMLVDDEERFLVTTRKLMEKKGFSVETANSGITALEKLKQVEVHVIVLDVKMPGMDGLTVLKEIKTLYPLVEVIMLTGHATIESAIDGLKLGATDYLMKPTDLEDLMIKVNDAYTKRQTLEEKIRVAQSKKYLKFSQDSIKEEG